MDTKPAPAESRRVGWGAHLRHRAGSVGLGWLVEAGGLERWIERAERLGALRVFVRDLETGILHFGVLPSRQDLRRLLAELDVVRAKLEALEDAVDRLEGDDDGPSPSSGSGSPSSSRRPSRP